MKQFKVQRLLVSAVLFGMTLPAVSGDFSQTCWNLSLEGSRLMASCKRMNQRVVPTAIDLDRGIGNLDGNLAWGDKNFSRTCQDIRLRGATLRAECQRIDGSFSKTRLDLNERIDNTDGVLRFDR